MSVPFPVPSFRSQLQSTNGIVLKVLDDIAAQTEGFLSAARLQPGVQIANGDGLALPYKPRWTAATLPALVDGSLVGRYTHVGQLVTFVQTLTIGALTTLGAGAWIFTLPVRALSVDYARPVMTAFAQDASASAPYSAVARAGDEDTFRVVSVATPGTFYAAAVPFAWAVGDILVVSGSYFAAERE